MRRLLLAAAAVVLTAQAASAVPIPSTPTEALLVPFTGHAWTPRPLAAQDIPRHPFMAVNGASNIHDDAYQSDAYARSGPLGSGLTVTSAGFLAECASVTFDRRGRLVTVCPSPTGATLRVLDPTTLTQVTSYDLPERKPGTFTFNNFSGGGYFYLDQADRAVVSTFTGHLLTLAVGDRSIALVRDVDLTAATKGSGIQSALPDWSGRTWFVTTSGVVGVISLTGTVRSRRLPGGETIANSFAIDESGGVFVVSTGALYRFDATRAGGPGITWRQPYDRGTRQKPGQVSQGSGTTPTLIGRASSPGGGSIAITDNADPQMHVLVFRRGKAGPGPALCRQPVFPSGRGDDENSLISVPGGLIAENNYGYAGPLPSGGTRSADTVPGVVRVDVDYRRGGCHVAWSNTTARVPSLVSKVSLTNGLLYAYTHPSAAELPYRSAVHPPAALAPDAFFLTAFDVRSGRQVWSQLAGSGPGWNNNYAPVTLGPDGTAYVGTVGGLVRIADSR